MLLKNMQWLNLQQPKQQDVQDEGAERETVWIVLSTKWALFEERELQNVWQK